MVGTLVTYQTNAQQLSLSSVPQVCGFQCMVTADNGRSCHRRAGIHLSCRTSTQLVLLHERSDIAENMLQMMGMCVYLHRNTEKLLASCRAVAPYRCLAAASGVLDANIRNQLDPPKAPRRRSCGMLREISLYRLLASKQQSLPAPLVDGRRGQGGEQRGARAGAQHRQRLPQHSSGQAVLVVPRRGVHLIPVHEGKGQQEERLDSRMLHTDNTSETADP